MAEGEPELIYESVLLPGRLWNSAGSEDEHRDCRAIGRFLGIHSSCTELVHFLYSVCKEAP